MLVIFVFFVIEGLLMVRIYKFEAIRIKKILPPQKQNQINSGKLKLRKENQDGRKELKSKRPFPDELCG